ncbi:unnamed protein product [Paramecium octaurelia]|uniref:Carboxypeptidase n=1 Tax=Paramecium octaurelia TaxID=43137 RepID=A0A8S1TMA3_PAROT|nr:unnamed protein product [Paramecium octaurelia]
MNYFLILVCVVLSYSEIINEKISQLPSDYKHKWYGGYLNDNQIYYQFLVSQSDPDSDPLFMWMQGGPGCSSLFGSFYEIGPFQFKPLSNESFINPYAWNKKANLLFLELPKGVGFSNPSKYQNDASAAQDALDALLDFFVQFPNYENRPFYIGGESYAGMYIPYLASLIINQSKNTINLKGILVGNGCTLGSECTDLKQLPLFTSKYQFNIYFQRGFLSLEDKQKYDQLCLDFTSPRCIELQKQLLAKIQYSRVDINNMLGECYHNDPDVQQGNGQNKRNHLNKHKRFLHFKGITELPCNYEYGNYFMLNNKTVQDIIHAKHMKWGSCSSSLDFKEDEQGSYRFYSQFLHYGLKIWIYSGDVDSNVPITGTLDWIQMLVKEQNLQETDPWRAWFMEGKKPKQRQVGGLTWEFNKQLRFISVRGAGHEVPFWKPQAGYVLFDNFIYNNTI